MKGSVGRLTAALVVLLLPSLISTASLEQASTASQTPAGLWRTTDDATGKPSGDILIFEQGGAYFGRIEHIYDLKDRDSICDLCKDDRKDQKVLGMVILRGIRLKAGRYEGGELLDPNTGSIYKCSFRLEDGGQRLALRGYVGFSWFGRTQTWERLGN